MMTTSLVIRWTPKANTSQFHEKILAYFRDIRAPTVTYLNRLLQS